MNGTIDLAVTTYHGYGPVDLHILLNDGDSFVLTSSLPLNEGSAKVAASDIDNDGDIDLAVTNRDAAMFSVFLNDGAGAFSLAHEVSTGRNPAGLDFGHFNSDGFIDIAIACSSLGSVDVFLNDTNGSFVLAHRSEGGQSRDVVATDFDADGDTDLVALQPSYVRTLLNDGTGSFVDMPGWGQLGGQSWNLGVGDLDGDGFPDIVASLDDGDYINIMKNNQGSGFLTRESYSTGYDPAGVCLRDLNEDGTVDIFVTTRSSAGGRSFLNNGDGSFEEHQSLLFTASSYTSSAVIEDFDSDGILDVACAALAGVAVFSGERVGRFRDGVSVSGTGMLVRDIESGGFLEVGGYGIVAVGEDENISFFDLSYGVEDIVVHDDITAESCYAVAQADFDNDGHIDIVVADYDLDQLRVYSGLHRGDYQVSSISDQVGSLSMIEPTDYNRDGKVDLIGYDGHGYLVLLQGMGSGEFYRASEYPSTSLKSIKVFDQDGDGDQDFVVLTRTGFLLTYRLLGVDTYFAINSYFVSQSATLEMDHGDLNGDGLDDLAIVRRSSSDLCLGIYLSDGTGGFELVECYDTAGPPVNVIIADIDGDLDMDMLCAIDWGTIVVFENTGDLASPNVTHYILGISAAGLSLGDFEGDGDLDLVAHSYSIHGSRIQLLPNRLNDDTPACFPDLTSDGELNFFDISAFIVAYAAADPIADFTHDGVFNFFDISAFLVAFNAGCP